MTDQLKCFHLDGIISLVIYGFKLMVGSFTWFEVDIKSYFDELTKNSIRKNTNDVIIRSETD